MTDLTLSKKALSEAPLRDFASRVVEVLAADHRFSGLLAGGSAIAGNTDAYSDLDLILIVREEAYAEVLGQRRTFAETLGPLLYAFTGEHVGEPRLLICLYGGPLLHVDLKFVTLEDLDQRVEDPLILWDRDGLVAARLAGGKAQWPNRPPEWFEERVWIWLHYAATKLGRGELLEVLDMLAFLRAQVLGPLALRRAQVDQRGVRRLETVAPESATALADTLGDPSARGCATALRQAVRLYLDFRADIPPANHRPQHEADVQEYVEAVIGRALQAPA